MKRKHADLAIEYFSDNRVEVQRKVGDGPWINDDSPQFYSQYKYRKKPKLVKCRIAVTRDSVGSGKYIDVEVEKDGVLEKLSDKKNFIKYKTDWIEIEI